eukprot:NODE_1359_length_2506_cov_3.658260.p1 GENE.NODE_1359_length_2506_cov_3.658260~~NODE_1359_length_2506_cov_3.658260.p1  ORF type:complete len:612 (+),score=183.44 NODE_1359_length_2506_cov_3.658260:456-2291(+)
MPPDLTSPPLSARSSSSPLRTGQASLTIGYVDAWGEDGVGAGLLGCDEHLFRELEHELCSSPRLPEDQWNMASLRRLESMTEDQERHDSEVASLSERITALERQVDNATTNVVRLPLTSPRIVQRPASPHFVTAALGVGRLFDEARTPRIRSCVDTCSGSAAANASLTGSSLSPVPAAAGTSPRSILAGTRVGNSPANVPAAGVCGGGGIGSSLGPVPAASAHGGGGGGGGAPDSVPAAGASSGRGGRGGGGEAAAANRELQLASQQRQQLQQAMAWAAWQQDAMPTGAKTQAMTPRGGGRIGTPVGAASPCVLQRSPWRVTTARESSGESPGPQMSQNLGATAFGVGAAALAGSGGSGIMPSPSLTQTALPVNSASSVANNTAADPSLPSAATARPRTPRVLRPYIREGAIASDNTRGRSIVCPPATPGVARRRQGSLGRPASASVGIVPTLSLQGSHNSKPSTPLRVASADISPPPATARARGATGVLFGQQGSHNGKPSTPLRVASADIGPAPATASRPSEFMRSVALAQLFGAGGSGLGSWPTSVAGATEKGHMNGGGGGGATSGVSVGARATAVGAGDADGAVEGSGQLHDGGCTPNASREPNVQA